MENFAILGAAGFVAPRHMTAIRSVGGDLIAAYDKNDSVGVLDRHFPNCKFFGSFEDLNAYLTLNSYEGKTLDWLSICSPNYMHLPQIIYGLEKGVNVICEKPLVLSLSELQTLKKVQERTKKKVFCILQLRLHDVIRNLKKRMDSAPNDTVLEVDLKYVTTRGPWYDQSWKSNHQLSGGLAANIGVHFFDMLCFVFGGVISQKLFTKSSRSMSGKIQLEKATVNWFLSIDASDLIPLNEGLSPTYRSIKIQNEELEFSGGFEALHDLSYKEILVGNGFGLVDVEPSVAIIDELNNLPVCLP